MTDDKNTLAGRCLCGSVAFEVVGPIKGVGSCHCSKCRKVSGTGGNAQFIVRMDKFMWRQGEDNIATFKLPDGWGPARCRSCGSPLPATYDNGQRMWVPAGLMEDALRTDIKQHICAAAVQKEQTGRGRGWALWKGMIILAGLIGTNAIEAGSAQYAVDELLNDFNTGVKDIT